MAINRSEALDERILESLAEGILVTKLCRDEKMPNIRQLQRWRRDDASFDDACWSAEAQGLMVQRSNLIECMLSAIKDGGPGSSIQIQGLRELLHENGRTAGRLVTRMSDRAQVRVENPRHMTIGWLDAWDPCTKCGHDPKGHIFENQSANVPALDAPSKAIEDMSKLDR
jgi:hypothetical protein